LKSVVGTHTIEAKSKTAKLNQKQQARGRITGAGEVATETKW